MDCCGSGCSCYYIHSLQFSNINLTKKYYFFDRMQEKTENDFFLILIGENINWEMDFNWFIEIVLSSKYRYIWLDFETTWLDLLKDEPIQLWIVEIDVNWNIIGEYKTLLHPQKELKELKNIVSFITNINLEDLVSAPNPSEVEIEVARFFGDNTVIIWHNIAFDLSFLNRFFPSLKYAFSIDTFQLSQAIVPYAPSYALEILSDFLEEKPLFLQRKSKFWLSFTSDDSVNFHDALFDTKATLALFCYIVEFLWLIQENTPILKQLLNKSDVDFLSILPYYEYNASDTVWSINVPALKKIAPADTSFTKFPYGINTDNLESKKRYYVWNLGFRSLLQSLLANKKTILVFASKPKLDIAKNILNEMWIKNIWFAREEQTISSKMFQNFLNKQSFCDFEILFIIKYCVHLFYWYWVLDLNSKWDYKVYWFIKDSREIVKYPLVLTTHQWLYSLIEKDIETYKDFQIVFFDVEWWYRNYNQYLSRTCDLYYIQNFVDMLLYKYNLLQEMGLIQGETFSVLQEFDTFFTMFIWILRTETKKLFVDRPEDEIQINPIVSSIEFYQTNLLLPKLKDFESKLQTSLQLSDFKTLRSQIEHFFSITETVAKVQRKMYSQSDFYFLFSEDTKFTNWDEFLDIFQDRHIIFLSNHEKSYSSIISDVLDFSEGKLPHLKAVVDLYNVLWKMIKKWDQSIFIISTVKDESREIFEYLQTLPELSDFELLVENITWWVWKNIYKAHMNDKKIVVWGYNFLMMCYAQKVIFDQLIIWNIKWAQSELILTDMQRYAPEK